MSGGRKEEGRTSGETAGRRSKRREEGGGRTSGETAGRKDERREGRMSREPVLGRDCPMGVYE